MPNANCNQKKLIKWRKSKKILSAIKTSIESDNVITIYYWYGITHILHTHTMMMMMMIINHKVIQWNSF